MLAPMFDVFSSDAFLARLLALLVPGAAGLLVGLVLVCTRFAHLERNYKRLVLRACAYAGAFLGGFIAFHVLPALGTAPIP